VFQVFQQILLVITRGDTLYPLGEMQRKCGGNVKLLQQILRGISREYNKFFCQIHLQKYSKNVQFFLGEIWKKYEENLSFFLGGNHKEYL